MNSANGQSLMSCIEPFWYLSLYAPYFTLEINHFDNFDNSKDKIARESYLQIMGIAKHVII